MSVTTMHYTASNPTSKARNMVRFLTLISLVAALSSAVAFVPSGTKLHHAIKQRTR